MKKTVIYPSVSFRRIVLIVSMIFLSSAVNAQFTSQLKVSDNKRFLVKDDGRPFFYLGDTGWELFHRLNKDEAYTYLSNRASKGFTVVQCVVLSEIDGLIEPNANGDLPFENLDTDRPNEKYFRHVDQVVALGNSMGLYMAMLPTWGAWVMKEQHPLFKPIHLFEAGNAYRYGKFMGNRYKNMPGIIWVLGGDRNADGYEKVWEAMAKGLREGDGGIHLITYHPRGQMSSSAFWQNASWLDFNMIQSGHATRNVNSYDFIANDYLLKPNKPTFDGETNYEDHPVSFHPSNGWFNDYDVRVSSYFSVFAGGFGVTYGCHNIWQMNTGKRPVSWARHTWQESLDLPGAFQMRYLRNLIESRPFLTRFPDQEVLLAPETALVPFEGKGMQHMQATRDGSPGNKDATYIMVYMPVGRGMTINTSYIPGKKIRAWWYDPRQGAAIPLGESDNTGTIESGWNTLPWHNGAGPDWVFVVDDAAKNYPPPGKLQETKQGTIHMENSSTLLLMKKRVLLDSSKILYNKMVTAESLANDWTIHHSEWKVEDGWLVGENRGNWPGMAVLKQNFPGNVLVEFEAQTILPSSHDINVMWNGEWIAETDKRGLAYVAGLQGWWTGKVGIEKSDEYKFMVGTPLLDFKPGKIYKIQAGSIDGHCFIFADGKLLLEAMDPDPIDNQKYAKVGLEAYCSKIRVRNMVIRQIRWEPVSMEYKPEF